MQNLSDYTNNLLSSLDEIEKLGKSLSLQLSLLSQEIRYIFSLIKETTSLSAAEKYFDMLQKIQSSLAVLSFKNDISLPEKLNYFVQDFDRIDDPWLRDLVYKKLKNNQYKFGIKLN